MLLLYFLFLLRSLEMLQNGTVVASVPYSITLAGCSKRSMMSQKGR